MVRQEGALLLFDLGTHQKAPQIQKQDGTGKRKSNHTPQVRFIVSYELTLHYSNTYQPQHNLELLTKEVTIHELIFLCASLKIAAKKSALYSITTPRKWKLQCEVLPDEIKNAVQEHVKAHASKDEEVRPLPVKLIVKRKTANNVTPGKTKIVKETFVCSCGFTVVDQYTANLKSSTLFKMGMKRKRFTDTKEVFYHMMHKAKCNGHYEN